jgi:hypothetical protein
MSNEYELGTTLRLVLVEFQTLELQRLQPCIYVPFEQPFSEARAFRPPRQSVESRACNTTRLQNTQIKQGNGVSYFSPKLMSSA